MKKFRHKKIKNTGVLFELLVRQLSSDVMKGVRPVSLYLIQKYFKENTELGKELNLYQILLSEKYKKSEYAIGLVNTTLKARESLNEYKLKREKYHLIKDLKNHYDLDSFFRTRLNNYQVYASIYNVFEHNEKQNPKEFIKNQVNIVEYVCSDKIIESKTTPQLLSEEDKDLRSLSFKFLVDKFNKKWSTLDKHQRLILREYVNNATNSAGFRKFINKEIQYLKTNLEESNRILEDEVLRIKVKEVVKLLDIIKEAKFVKDRHLLALLRYHDLVKEIKK